MPEDKPSWKDTNLALIGSDLDHKVKQAAAEGEPQWQGLGEETGTFVWRIEQFKVVPWPKPKYGKFHVGDSYIVLNSYKIEGEDDINHDVHIWIGKESSQDEYGTSAYKMVECDDYLGDEAIQHRQVQGAETDKFLSYFGGSVMYLPGGVESGFTHVEPTEDEPHLYRVKGTQRGLSLTQMDLSKSSLNKGDSFILFANPASVWIWHGEDANPDEKARAVNIGEKMCTEGTAAVLEQSDEDEAFWKYLGDGEIQEADDSDHEVKEFTPVLYKVIPDSEPEEVAQGEALKFVFGGAPAHTLKKDLLDDTDVFILDVGWEVFVWIGKNADKSEKIGAIKAGDDYCKSKGRTDVPLGICKSGRESYDFNKYFS